MITFHEPNSLCCLRTILGATVLVIRFGKWVFTQLVKEHIRLSLRSTLISSFNLHVSLPIGFFPASFLAETLNSFTISLFVSRANYMLRTSHLSCFNILLTVHPNTIIVFFTNLMHKFFITSIILLYMFRTLLCSSSGGHIVSVQHLVPGIVTLFTWLFGAQVKRGLLS